MTTKEYREAFECGYFYGRIDAINGAEYDDRTPLAKREETEGDAHNDAEQPR
ncbi:hypothetical protein [Paenibacillus sp. FSL K6-2859]|uniref:hypothetical protein n=1 Tax=Paenibacillus sp. FSL K6-2859 TaxID=2921482 RepID=UPI0030FC0F1F